jgi:glycosyltransferase involved in cell wall biosynthesis
MSNNKNILYITYDGMTDPLGQSQVLPYLIGLTKQGYKFTILSFEKKDRYVKYKHIIEKITADAGIKWEPLSFTTKPPVLSKYYDMVRMKRKVLQLHKANSFDMIHCRSYLAANLGLMMKKTKGVKFLFDMRGFWADEKKDGGSWNQDKFFFRKVYKHYKKKEAEYVQEADAMISLTEAGKAEIMKWPAYNSKVPMFVIPCCSDMEHFSLTTAAEKQKGRELLGLPQHELVISYLGSIGSWYMVDEMLELFTVVKEKYAGAKFLFLTHSSPQLILSQLAKYNISREDIVITEATRAEVPLYTKASDINISFIKPVYSKLASSPTKLGEVLAMGIPVIVNSGIGDVEQIVTKTKSGFMLRHFNADEYRNAVDHIEVLLQLSPAAIREAAEAIYSLKNGVKKYSDCYAAVLKSS